MHPQDLLPTLAEMAVTFLGFTGILVALRPAAAGQWSTSELFRIKAILLIPGVVTVTAVLPFGLSGFSESPAIVWGVPLVFFGLITSAFSVRVIIERRRGDYQPTKRAIATAMMVSGAVANILALLSGLGLVVPFSPGLLVLVLCWSLVLNAATFILMLVFWAKTSAGQLSDPAGAAGRRHRATGDGE